MEMWRVLYFTKQWDLKHGRVLLQSPSMIAWKHEREISFSYWNGMEMEENFGGIYLRRNGEWNVSWNGGEMKSKWSLGVGNWKPGGLVEGRGGLRKDWVRKGTGWTGWRCGWTCIEMLKWNEMMVWSPVIKEWHVCQWLESKDSGQLRNRIKSKEHSNENCFFF